MMLFDISVVSVVLSLCGVLLTWVTFYTFEESRCSSRRLLLACSLSDFGQSVVWGVMLLQKACLQEILYYFRLSSILWTCCYAYHMQLIFTRQRHHPERLWHSIAWGLPALGLLIRYGIRERYNSLSDMGCWMTEKMDNEELLLASFYIPAWCCLFFNIIMYYRWNIVLKKQMSSEMETKVKWRCLEYVTAFLLGIIFDSIRVVSELYHPESENNMHILWILTSLFAPLQGGMNAIVYGINGTIRNRYKTLFSQESSSSSREDTRSFSPSSSQSHFLLAQRSSLIE